MYIRVHRFPTIIFKLIDIRQSIRTASQKNSSQQQGKRGRWGGNSYPESAGLPALGTGVIIVCFQMARDIEVLGSLGL